MPPSQTDQSNLTWIVYSLLTVVSWGLYGVFLHSGQTLMKDPDAGRYKAFLFVGIAYFITAVLAPLAVLWIVGAKWTFTSEGMTWSLLAGIVGAAGAFCVLLAFGAKGTPSVVMSIVFAGAPLVNAVVALWMHPPAGGLRALPWQFVAGIVLAAIGGCLVTLYRPMPAAKPPAAVSHEAAVPVQQVRP